MTFKPVRRDSTQSHQRNTIIISSEDRNHALVMGTAMISVETEGQFLVLRFHTDRFDATNAAEFSQALEDLTLEDVGQIVLDFEQVKLIDSSAVGVLIDLYKRLPDGSRSIAIRHPQPSVAAIIEFLRLHRIFRLESSDVS